MCLQMLIANEYLKQNKKTKRNGTWSGPGQRQALATKSNKNVSTITQINAIFSFTRTIRWATYLQRSHKWWISKKMWNKCWAKHRVFMQLNCLRAITRAKAKTSSSNLTGTEKKISTCNSWFKLEHHILHLNLSIILLTEMAEIELSQKYEVRINLRCTFITKTISRVVTARECWNDDERLDWSNLITSEYCNGRMNSQFAKYAVCVLF